MMRQLAAAALAFILLGIAGASAEIATGCLTPTGRITKVAIGEEPARPCRGREIELVLQVGDSGDQNGVQVVSFFVELEFGAQETLASSGPLELIARCSTETGTDTVQVLVTSSEDGWLMAGEGGPPRLALEEAILAESTRVAGALGSEPIARTRAFTGDGATISVLAGDAFLNVFEYECLVGGSVEIGELPSAPVIP